MIFKAFLVCCILAAVEVQAGRKCPAVDGPDSVYIPDKDCTKFWQCSNGTPYRFDCPANLHFNRKLNVCDWPEQAGCDGSGGSDSGSDEDRSDSSNSSNSSEEVEEPAESGEGKGSDESSGSSESGKCPPVDGKDSVYIPDKDCGQFWQCSNGVPYLQKCPAGLHFNPKLNVCDWPNQAGCGGSGSSSSEEDVPKPEEPKEPSEEVESVEDSGSSSSSESGSGGDSDESSSSGKCPSVDGKDSVYIPDKDCGQFWQCSNGVPYLQKCPSGLHFNPELNVCDWPDQAGCGGSGSGSSSSEEDVPRPEEPEEPEKPSEEVDSGSSSNSSESGSGGDSDESSSSGKCPSVDGKDSVYFPDKDCGQFWQCSNGVPYLQKCPSGLHFNPELNVCDWPDQAGCGGSGSGSSSSEEDVPRPEEPEEPSEEVDSGSSSSSSESGSGGDSSEEDGSSIGGKCPSVDGKDSVYIPDKDCGQFWQCSNGVPYLQKCPSGLHFNPKLNVCDWPTNAGCKGD